MKSWQTANKNAGMRLDENVNLKVKHERWSKIGLNILRTVPRQPEVPQTYL